MNYNIDIEDFNVDSEKEAMEVFRSFRWDNDIHCPHCKSKKYGKNGKYGETQNYICNECKKSFNDFTNTFFYNHKMSMKDVFYIFYNAQDKTIKKIAEELEISPRHVSSKVKFFKEVFLKERSVINYDEREKVLRSITPGSLYNELNMKFEKEQNHSLDDFKELD